MQICDLIWSKFFTLKPQAFSQDLDYELHNSLWDVSLGLSHMSSHGTQMWLSSVLERSAWLVSWVSMEIWPPCWHLASFILEVNSSPPGKNGRHLGRRQIQMHFINENDRILIQISLKFVHMSLIDNKPALVQVMAWCRRGDKPLPEPMLTWFTDTYMRH